MADKPYDKDIFHWIEDAAQHLVNIRFIYHPDRRTIGEIREAVKKADLKSFEEYMALRDKTPEETEAAVPGAIATFNDLKARLQNPDLTMQEYREIWEKLGDRSWFKRKK